MKFKNTGIESFVIDLNMLDDTMERIGFVRAGQWDYERVSYDYKFEILQDVYYLRVQGYTKDGDVGAHDALIQLVTPILGKHYYPHGVEYGSDEVMPTQVVTHSEELLKRVSEALATLPKL